MNIINVTRSSMPDYDEYCDEIKELWDSCWLTNMGIKHNQLQRELQSRLNVNNVILYTNGHLALENMISALNLPKGGEVITTPFTFASTTHAIVRNGLKPVFCDINENDFTIDVSKIEKLITKNTRAIVPVHVYGNICNIEEINRIAEKYNLNVVYDAAHAFGVKYKGISSACFGDASMFSFHSTKVFNTIEGGALCFNDEQLVQKLNDMKNFGIHAQDDVIYVGTNAKMNEFQAAMGICNLRHFDNAVKKRKKVVERYRNHLSKIEGIQLNTIQENVETNYAYFPVIFDEKVFGKNRDKVMEELMQNGIVARKYFYPLTSLFKCYNNEYILNKTPIALKISENVLTLPLYEELELNHVDRICDIIMERKR